MGNYITIPNKTGVKAKLETAYNKHLLINKSQFNNDFGDTKSFEDVFEFENENQKEFNFKTGVLDKDFYSVEFMQDIQKVVLGTSIEIVHDTTDEKHNEFEKEIKVKYFDVTGCNGIYLAKVPNSLKVGDIFNVYAFESTKFGCEWLGNLEDSLINLALSDYFIEHYNELYNDDDFEKYSVSLLDKDDKAIAIEEFNTNFLPDAKRKYAEFLKEGFDKEEIVLWQRNTDEGYKLLESTIISKENDPRLIEA